MLLVAGRATTVGALATTTMNTKCALHFACTMLLNKSGVFVCVCFALRVCQSVGGALCRGVAAATNTATTAYTQGNGQVRPNKARQGKARQGKARQSKARQGKARQGKAANSPQAPSNKKATTTKPRIKP